MTKDTQRYQSGTIRPARNKRGGFDCYIRVDGRDHRARHPTLTAARAWIDMVRFTTHASREPLTALQMADALHAIQLLPPGSTLTDAARALAKVVRPVSITLPLSQAVDRFLAEREAEVKPITLRNYRHVLRKLQGVVGARPLGEVTPEHIKAVLAGFRGISRNTTHAGLTPFFNWCVENELIERSPAARVKRARRVEPPKGVLTVEQAELILGTAAVLAPRMVPYLAVGLFAGIRPAELARIPPRAIGPEYILISGAHSKVSAERSIAVQPNLRAWLEAFPPAGPAIAPFADRHRGRIRRELVKAAGIPWPQDCMRHSWVTYHLEQTRDTNLVIQEAGHSVAVMIRSYRALAIPGDGKRFFDIYPACPVKRPTWAEKSKKLQRFRNASKKCQ